MIIHFIRCGRKLVSSNALIITKISPVYKVKNEKIMNKLYYLVKMVERDKVIQSVFGYSE